MNRRASAFVLGLITGVILIGGYHNCSSLNKSDQVLHPDSKPQDRSIASVFAKEEYAPYTFTLKLNDQEIEQRWIREYVLSVERLSARGPAAAFDADATVVSIMPREKFPKPWADCGKILLVLHEFNGDFDDAEQSRSQFAEQFAGLREKLNSVRGFEVEGEMERFRDAKGAVACRTHASTSVKMKFPYDASPKGSKGS